MTIIERIVTFCCRHAALTLLVGLSSALAPGPSPGRISPSTPTAKS